MTTDDGNLEILGYNLIRSDHPCNSKRGGVCICYKRVLPLRVLNIYYLKESISFVLKIGDKLCNLKFCENYERDFPAGKYMFKVNNRNTRTMCEICSELTIKTPEQRQWRRSLSR